MRTLAIAAEAEQDLCGIWAYIAADDVAAANRVTGEIDAEIQRLLATPGSGHVAEELAHVAGRTAVPGLDRDQEVAQRLLRMR